MIFSAIDSLLRLVASIYLFITVISYISTLIKRRFLKLTGLSPASSPQTHCVLITGCDTGFGHILSKNLSKIGYHVVSACLTEEGVVSLTDVVMPVQCDVTVSQDVVKLISAVDEYCIKNNLKLWAVINNAGMLNIYICRYADSVTNVCVDCLNLFDYLAIFMRI